MKQLKKSIILGFIIITLTTNINSQDFSIPFYYRNFINIDSILFNSKDPVILFPEITVVPEKDFSNIIERIRYNRLVRNFLVVYPYVLEISEIYNNIEDSLKMLQSDRLRRNYIKKREKEIFDNYKPKMKKMTLSQGILMVKLLDRETGNSAYEIVEDFRGSVRAFFWQGFALLFGNNLKTRYDAKGIDSDIEYLVTRYGNPNYW